ncbi:MAG: hypothetical protein IT452_12965 [Planctomycetia bacterium]|nr:hypothetical protein [Planctomycetia bacterium]
MADRDLNEVLREFARKELARAGDEAAFEAWMRVGRPESPERLGETLEAARDIAAAAYAGRIRDDGDRFEAHARRALRVVEALERAADVSGDAQLILESKAVLLGLAERAVLQARDRATEQEARLRLELLRAGC